MRRGDPPGGARSQALRLRARGLSYADILGECDYRSEQAARSAVWRLMQRENKGAVEEAKGLHRERIEALLRSLWMAAVNPGMAQQAARENHQPAPPDQRPPYSKLPRNSLPTSRVHSHLMRRTA